MAKDSKHLRGMNIWIDDKGRDIYYDRFFTKCGYVINEKNKGTYAFYANRFFLPIIATVLVMNFILNETQSIFLGILLYIILELLFRLKFLPSLTKLKKFKPQYKLRLVEQIQSQDRNKTIILAFLLVAFAILLVINVHMEGFTGMGLFLSYLLAAGALFYAIVYFKAVLTKPKDQTIKNHK